MFEFLRPKPKVASDSPSAKVTERPRAGAESPDDLAAMMQAAADAARAGDAEAAIAGYARVINQAPGHAAAHYKLGNLYKDQGKLEEAIAAYDRATTLEPGYAHAFCNRGVVLDRLGRWDEALASYDQALAIDPADAVSHQNRAMALRKLDRADEALASFERAIAVNPGYAEAYCNRGTLLQDLKQWDAALASYDRSIELHPGLAFAYFNRAVVLQARKRPASALADYDRAIALDPRHADAYCNRGLVLGELERPEEALASIDRAIELAPDSVIAHFNRAEALMAKKQFEAAIAAYDRAFLLKPSHPFLLGSRRFAKMILCDWSGIDADTAQLSTALLDMQPVAPPFQVAALIDDPVLQHRAGQIWTNTAFPGDPGPPGFAWPAAGGKIHLGYFSADFREHPVSMLTAELFELHDRSKFELTAFSFGPDTQDPMRKRLEGSFDRFVDVRSFSAERITSLARELRVDIAIDLGGHTAEARTNIFALRAAPVQVNYLGYPGTMGADYFDYLIADRIVVPASQSHHYSEKIVHLPGCFLPNDSTREIAGPMSREQCGLPLDAFVFCCFNNSYKLNPPVFDAWMRILGRVAGSHLWLSQHHPTATANLRRQASRRGIDPARLIFASRAPTQPGYLARMRLGDLFLDTLPYNAHTTAIDALWAGLPVLTRIGKGFPGRVAASLLNAADLRELVTSTLEDYENLAVDLAASPDRLAAIRRKLTSRRLESPLFDTPSLTKHLESAYGRMHERRVTGQPPASMFAQAEED